MGDREIRGVRYAGLGRGCEVPEKWGIRRFEV